MKLNLHLDPFWRSFFDENADHLMKTYVIDIFSEGFFSFFAYLISIGAFTNSLILGML